MWGRRSRLSLTSHYAHNPSSVTPASVVTPEIGHSVSPRKRQSKVCDRFELGVDPCFAVCRHCRASLSRGKIPGHYSTSSLNLHLKRQHQSLLLGAEAGTAQVTGARGKQRAAGAASVSSPSALPSRVHQATIDEMGWGKYGATKWKFPTPDQITNCLGEMVVLDDQPFSLVENAGFQRLMALVVL